MLSRRMQSRHIGALPSRHGTASTTPRSMVPRTRSSLSQLREASAGADVDLAPPSDEQQSCELALTRLLLPAKGAACFTRRAV